jgi:hypothetical protein
MKKLWMGILCVFIGVPLYGQGLTLTMKENGPIGQTAPTLQTDRTHARLDIPSLVSQVLYDSTTKTLQVLIPLLRNYREYTPASIQQSQPAAGPAGRGQPAAALMPITYKRTGTSKVQNWPCTTYDGFRGTEKVVEVCAAEGKAIDLTRADFSVIQQALDLAKGVAPPEMIERIPAYGTVASQGFAGFPVRRVSFRNGQPETTMELVEIRREAVPAANFAVPPGFVRIP